MIYHSTRNEQLTASSTHAVLQGIAPDGGLYICDPAALHFDWRAALEKDTLSMAADILHALLPDFENMEQLVRDSYAGKFPTSDLTPLTPVADKYVLELYHGPTSAFKDVALSVLPRLIVAAAKAEGMKGDVVILTATSGDTGKAAMEGFHDVPGTRITVFYPHGGVSAVQQAQMATQEGNNVRVCAVRGNFDDAQTGVKNIFAACKDRDLHSAMLSSANSINIGRLAPQVVYYFRAYGDLVKAGRIKMGDVVDYTVPTGNFGDILAGYFAREMGLPVGRLICASNANDVLTEFLTTGRYDKRRPFYKTTSPSMDILVSSNLERLLYLVSGDAGYVAQLMAQLNEQGWYQVSGDILARLQAVFGCGCCNDAGAAEVIGRLWREQKYLCDPHTAVAWSVAESHTRGEAPMVVLSGSMSGTAEDHIEVGDLIFTKQADIDELKVGDVVAFMDGSIVVTHRIVSISADRTEFVTKGDANNTEDEPISADQIIGQYSGRIPKVGDFALFLQKPLGMVIFIGVPVCAFVVWDILRRRRETRAGDEEKEQLRRELERLKAEKPAE